VVSPSQYLIKKRESKEVTKAHLKKKEPKRYPYLLMGNDLIKRRVFLWYSFPRGERGGGGEEWKLFKLRKGWEKPERSWSENSTAGSEADLPHRAS